MEPNPLPDDLRGGTERTHAEPTDAGDRYPVERSGDDVSADVRNADVRDEDVRDAGARDTDERERRSQPERTTKAPPVVPRTRAGAFWLATSIAVLVLILLIIFVAQNGRRTQVKFLWLDGNISLALALLIAAAFGALIVVIAGTARIIQLRLVARRNRKLEPM